MIKYNYEVSVNENRAKLNKDIFLFRGNRNIHYYFSIKGARFAFEKEGDLIENANAIYAAVTVIKPNGVEVANAIAPVENGLIHLKVTEDLIDEEVEIGDFDLVFDLFDDSDGAVTIPKIKGQFHVQERPCTTSIGTLSGNVNVVNQAVVDLAIATQENEQLIVVDDDGKYVKTTWAKGNKISVERLNKMEEGIYNNSSQLKENQINLIEDDTSMEGISDSVHDTLETTDKTIIGAINEVNDKSKDIVKQTITTEERNKLTNLENYDDSEIKNEINEKANINDVIKKGYGTLNDFDESTRAILQGLEVGQINAVLGARNVSSKNIELGSITPELIYGYSESINKYRKDFVIPNKTIGSANDFILNDSQTTGVAIIPVKPNTTYSKGTMKGLLNQGVMYLDYEKKFISYNAGLSTFTTSNNCYFIAFNIDNANLNTYFVVEGDSIPTKYEPYYYEYNFPEEYSKSYNYKYTGDFTKLNEWYNAKFLSSNGKLYPNGLNALLKYSVGYDIRNFVAQFKVTPKIYSDGAEITVIAISNNTDVTKIAHENSIGVAFKPTQNGNIIQGFNKGQGETLKWIEWTKNDDFSDQEYTVTIMKINHDISVNVVSTNEYATNNYGKVEYFYKVKDTSFNDLGIYVYSKDTRGENGLSINDMNYWCDLDFQSTERTTFWGETDSSNFRIYFPPNYNYKNKYNAIICFHGNGTDETQWSLNDNMLHVKNKLIENNYIVLTCSYKNSKTTWGNKYSTQAYYEAYKYLIDNFSNIDNIGIYCNSMGGIESLNFISENRLKPKCWVGTVPTYDLDANYSPTSGLDFSGIIRSAYEIQSDGSDYTKKTNGRNPAKMPNYLFSAIPMLCIGATGDVTVSPTDNIEKLYNDLYPVCNITKVIYNGGNHSDFDLANNLNKIVDFYTNNMNK